MQSKMASGRTGCQMASVPPVSSSTSGPSLRPFLLLFCLPPRATRSGPLPLPSTFMFIATSRAGSAAADATLDPASARRFGILNFFFSRFSIFFPTEHPLPPPAPAFDDNSVRGRPPAPLSSEYRDLFVRRTWQCWPENPDRLRVDTTHNTTHKVMIEHLYVRLHKNNTRTRRPRSTFGTCTPALPRKQAPFCSSVRPPRLHHHPTQSREIRDFLLPFSPSFPPCRTWC